MSLPNKGKQERTDGLKFLWCPNIEGDRGGIEWLTEFIAERGNVVDQ